MSVAVVSPAPSAAAPRQARVAASSAAQAYAVLQQDPMQQAARGLRQHRHDDKAPASPNAQNTQAPTAKSGTGGKLNILA